MSLLPHCQHCSPIGQQGLTWLRVGQIVFSFGSIECFYSDTSRWPLIIATFFVSFYLVVNFWFVCNYMWGTLIIFRIVSTSSLQHNFIRGAVTVTQLQPGLCWGWVSVPSDSLSLLWRLHPLPSKSWELVITSNSVHHQTITHHHHKHPVKWSSGRVGLQMKRKLDVTFSQILIIFQTFLFN